MTVLIEAVPLELHVDDAGVSELVVALVFRHGAECRAAEVEVEAGDRVVVHVRDDHRLRHPRARRVHTRQAPYLRFQHKNPIQNFRLQARLGWLSSRRKKRTREINGRRDRPDDARVS